MKKLTLLITFLLLLAACGGSPVPDEPAAAGEAAPATDVDTTAVSAELGDPFSLRDGDYFKGAEDPTFTIIEYGDFQ